MGLMDGAVSGMASRLVSAGFNPGEAFGLAQVAYIKEKKRAQGVPGAVLKRSEASQVINQALNLLGHCPLGAEAHRQRIILWEKVFGRGSWPEPFDPTDIYALPDLSGSPSSDEDISHDAAILNGALRYFDTVDLSFAGDRLWFTATLFRGSGDDQKQWNGFVIIFDGMFGFFEESDCLAKNIEDGGPVVFQLSELRDCAIRTPEEFRWFGGEHVRFLEASENFYITLSFTEGNKILRLFVPFEGLSPDLRAEAADSVRRMLHYLQKALELQADDSMPAGTDRPADLLQGTSNCEGETMMTHEQELRDWAKGSYTTQAATELLLNAFQGRFAQPGHPWIWIHELGGAAIDFGQIPQNVEILPDGERRLMLLVAAIAGVTLDEPIGDLIRHLDEANVDLVLTAIAQAAGRPELHKPAGLQIEEKSSRALG